jgi:hypothetical protein
MSIRSGARASFATGESDATSGTQAVAATAPPIKPDLINRRRLLFMFWLAFSGSSGAGEVAEKSLRSLC